MEKRYQVFVSSTYKDLQDERQEIIQALLELDCIPSGMELFPAANDDQWTLIKKVIDDSDYYLLIIGGRYGSLGPDGVSYTEMEYRYAMDKGKPIISFLHKSPQEIPANKSEQEKEGREKLQAFRSLAEAKLVRYWTTPSDLGSIVSRSLIMLIKTNPAIGWVRADQVPNEGISLEMLKLRKQIDDLQIELNNTRVQAPAGTDSLASGESLFEIHFGFTATNTSISYNGLGYTSVFKSSWNQIFFHLGPILLDEANEHEMMNSLNNFISSSRRKELLKEKNLKESVLSSFKINETDYQTIKIQLRALGLIVKSIRPRSVKVTITYWSLTPYGDEILTQLRAIKN
jgi:hypothetical protein